MCIRDRVSTVDAIMSRGVNGGGLAPGRVSSATREEISQVTGRDHDGYLSAGYLVWAPSLASVSDTLRAARQFPPIYCWGAASNVVNGVDVGFVVD